jgi:hypothetical protein
MSEDEGDFLTAKQIALYGRFGAAPTDAELERFFFLDDGDQKLIEKRRDPAMKLGFALQLTTMRFLGTFLADPVDVPLVVMEYVAASWGSRTRRSRRRTSGGIRPAWSTGGRFSRSMGGMTSPISGRR